ncbi:hypothetical protein F4677DRAFT_360584 [Hypoxylon crocopeplum]|nr:hypothetical protein F4677DRAFT_360584 [Hypoxylon crocopeplum]
MAEATRMNSSILTSVDRASTYSLVVGQRTWETYGPGLTYIVRVSMDSPYENEQIPHSLPPTHEASFEWMNNGVTDFANEQWARIFGHLSAHLADWPKLYDDMLRLMISIRTKLGFLLPIPGFQYTFSQLATWESFVRRSLYIYDEELSEIIHMQPYSEPRHEENLIPGNHGTVFYVTSWSLSGRDLWTLARHLEREEKTFAELRSWMTLNSKQTQPYPRVTIRYFGECSAAEGPYGLTPFMIAKYHDFHKPLAGVLAEFLPVIEICLPRVARSAKTHLLPGTFIGDSEWNAQELRWCTGAVLLAIFSAGTLVNRFDETLESWATACKAYSLLKTRFNIRALVDTSPCPMILTCKLRKLFEDMRQHTLNHPQLTGCQDEELALTEARCDFLQRQSAPLLYLGKKTLMVFVGKAMYLNDYVNNQPHMNGGSNDAKILQNVIRTIAKVEGASTAQAAPEFFPYYCYAPWPRRHDGEIPDEHMLRYLKTVRPMI